MGTGSCLVILLVLSLAFGQHPGNVCASIESLVKLELLFCNMVADLREARGMPGNGLLSLCLRSS